MPIDIDINKKEFTEALEELKRMEDSIDERWIKNTLRRKAKPIVSRMKSKGHSRFKPVLGVTTAKKKAGAGIKVGAVRQGDKSNFPDLTAPALASVLEYGTAERHRMVRAAGFITGRASTGSVTPQPWMRRSYDMEISGVIDDFEKTTIKRVEKKG